jgi:hypothetical protein
MSSKGEWPVSQPQSRRRFNVDLVESRVRLTRGAVPAGVLQMDQSGEGVRSGVGRVAGVNGQTGQIITEVAALSEREREREREVS